MLISKAVGFVREMVIAYHFGTSAEYDVYLVAVSIPIALFTLISGLSNLFIPVYAQASAAEDNETQFTRLWSNFNLLVVLTVGLTALVALFSSQIIRLTAPGFTPDQVALASTICRIASVIILFAVLETFFRSILNCEKRFYLPAAGPIAANCIFIVIVLFFSKEYSVYAIMTGLVLGYLAHMLLVYTGFRSSRIITYFSGKISKRSGDRFFFIAAIILIVEAASQLFTIIDRYFASSLPEGVISALGYTYILFMLPVSIFAYALSTAIFPYLTDTVVRKDRAGTGALLTKGINVTLLLALPISMLFFVFSQEIVILVFRRGAFDAGSVAVTSGLVRVFAIGMAGQSLIWLLYRAFYAARVYSVFPMTIAIAVGTKILFTYLLLEQLAEVSLGLSSSFSYSISAVFLIIMAGAAIAPLDWKVLLRYVIKLCVITAIGYTLAVYLRFYAIDGITAFEQLVWRVPLVMGVTVVIMGMAGHILRIPEVIELISVLVRSKKSS